ncbi:MAG: hypothetical protein R3E83_23335 [Burkholderiaceae bacterium]
MARWATALAWGVIEISGATSASSSAPECVGHHMHALHVMGDYLTGHVMKLQGGEGSFDVGGQFVLAQLAHRGSDSRKRSQSSFDASSMSSVSLSISAAPINICSCMSMMVLTSIWRVGSDIKNPRIPRAGTNPEPQRKSLSQPGPWFIPSISALFSRLIAQCVTYMSGQNRAVKAVFRRLQGDIRTLRVRPVPEGKRTISRRSHECEQIDEVSRGR